MIDLDQIKELQERKALLQAKYNSLTADVLKAMTSGIASDPVLLEFDALSKEIQAVNQQIFNIEHADEIKAEQERQAQEEERKAREQAEREKRLQGAKLAEEQRKAQLLAAARAKAEAQQKAKETAKAKIEAQESKLQGNFQKSSSSRRTVNSAEKVIDILKVQLTPSTICVEPNDVFIKTVFNACKSAYQALLGGKFYKIKEKRETKNKNAIFSKLEIQNVEGYDDEFPLDEYDRAVLGVIISEQVFGNRYTTIGIIHRALIGKPGQAFLHITPFKNQKAKIIDSVIKLMSTVVDFSGVNETLKEMNYRDKDGNEIILRSSNLLSADIIDAKINGQVMEGVIFFKANSPLFQIADAKDQVIRYPHALLNVPNQNNTPLVISLKKYVMRRICEIKLHKNLAPTITFDDVFKRCRLGKVSRDQEHNARKAILKFLDHLKAEKFVKNFEVKKRGNIIYGVTFSF